MTTALRSPFAIRNVRLFIAFRVCFNARFYYPVFTILFLDFGLTLEQFALLNAAWAASIVVLEVPSGAMADIIGRRNLLVVAGSLMVVEMLLLCLAPVNGGYLLVTILLINRLLSGAAEAAASGADEALAYDSLKAAGQDDEWGRVLETQMRLQALAYMVAMSVGAAVYDPDLMQRLSRGLGLSLPLTQAVTLRFPVYLTLVMALCVLIASLRMQETTLRPGPERPPTQADGKFGAAAAAFRLTLQAGRWILQTPFALVVILAGLLFDSCIRMLLTLSSQYYRTIHLPEATFGLIGSGMAALGLFIPRLARGLSQRHTPLGNMVVMALLTLVGLGGMMLVVPFWGLAPMVVLISVIYMNNFFISHYLNRITASEQRATVLSFKGLSYNLAYGLIGMLYSLLLAVLRGRMAASPSTLAATAAENQVFIASLVWFPVYFTVLLVVLLLYARWRLHNQAPYRRRG